MQVPNGLTKSQVDDAEIKAQGDVVLVIRKAWYNKIGDPMFFDEQRGKYPTGTWLTAVEKMKLENPYPEGYNTSKE
jgi:hypothetical protein